MDFDAHIAALKVKPGAKIIVHSRLISFGKIEGGVQTVYKSLRGAIGQNGTLVVPTYTMNLSETDVFKRCSTPSFGVGALSEHIRTLEGAIRSRCPIHSHAAVGPDAEILLTSDESTSIGAGSDFDLLHQNGFELLLLGCSFHEGATFIHHVEAKVGTPYREWIKLDRCIGELEVERKIEVNYYAKAEGCDLENNLHAVESDVTRRQLAKFAPVGSSGRYSYLLSLDNLENSVASLLKSDPYSLVRHP
jgi:aminoglycoside N3'-acetyltransferase